MCVCAKCQSVDTLYPPKRFPLRQGDLDSLCMPYAVLNAFNRMGRLDCVVRAEEMLTEVIAAIPYEEGKLVAAITEGFDPVNKVADTSDVNWVAEKVSNEAFLGPATRIDTCSAFEPIMKQSTAGCVVFFENANDDEESHYTFVLKSSSGVFALWDSYGFRQLRVEGASARVDGKPVLLKYAWPTI